MRHTSSYHANHDADWMLALVPVFRFVPKKGQGSYSGEVNGVDFKPDETREVALLCCVS